MGMVMRILESMMLYVKIKFVGHMSGSCDQIM